MYYYVRVAGKYFPEDKAPPGPLSGHGGADFHTMKAFVDTVHVCEQLCSLIIFSICVFITKTCLYNFDILKPHFYIVKLDFTGYILLFLFLLKT